MSYWITLKNAGLVVDTDTIRQEGGTYVFGGQTEAELNVTYNYARHFDFRQLDGMKAVEAMPILKEAIDKLKDDMVDDYWKPTEGNVKRAVTTLYEFARYSVEHKMLGAEFEVH